MGYFSCARHRAGVGRAHGRAADECEGRGIATAFVIMAWWVGSIVFGALIAFYCPVLHSCGYINSFNPTGR